MFGFFIMKKEWADIKGFEGMYKISNLGEIISLARVIKAKDGVQYPIKKKIKKLKVNTDGYIMVYLYKENKASYLYVHRLIGEYFIPNPLNLPCINHKNGDKSDNRICNLEWCTYSHNNYHAYKILNKKCWKSKAVLIYNRKGELLKEVDTVVKAAKFSKISRYAISDKLNGVMIKELKYIFKYKTQ